mgnify:CR=1 FL=1
MNYSVQMSMINGYTLTKLTLDSFFRSDPPPFRMMYLVADGTTEEILLNFLTEIQTKGYGNLPAQKFHVTIYKNNIGVARSLNRVMFTLQPDEDFLLLNNNTLFCYHVVQKMQDWIEKFSNVFVVAPSCLSPLPQSFYQQYMDLSNQYIYMLSPESFLLFINNFFQKNVQYSVEECLNFVSSCEDGFDVGDANDFLYIKNECLKQIGFFDEQFSWWEGKKICGIGEDWDYSTRITHLEKAIIRPHNIVFMSLVRHFTTQQRDPREVEESKIRFGQKYNMGTEQWKDVLLGHWQGKQREFLLRGIRDFVQVEDKKLLPYHSIWDH